MSECQHTGRIEYSVEMDNFYCATCKRGLGQNYYDSHILNVRKAIDMSDNNFPTDYTRTPAPDSTGYARSEAGGPGEPRCVALDVLVRLPVSRRKEKA